jgi:hypothetical protein
MRPSNKSRSRNKNNNNNNNRRQNPGNVINRVFDSSGPEGRVRGTPQQIIDKYQSLASDAVLSGDRVAHENFLQHSEHYSRLLVTAQREMDAKKEAQQQHQQQHQKQAPAPAPQSDNNEQPVIDAAPNQEVFPGKTENSALVDTPESGLIETPEATAPKKNQRRRVPKPKPAEAQPTVDAKPVTEAKPVSEAQPATQENEV